MSDKTNNNNDGKNESNLLDHNFDGIQECDNDLPLWWRWGFYLTIIFSVIYMGYYHFGGPGLSPVEIYEAEAAQIESQKYTKVVDESYKDDEFKNLTEANAIAAGKDLFNTRCTSCHGATGGGGIGPNLADKFWIHGGKPVQIATTIAEGIPEKGMVSWKSSLKRNEIISLVAFVRSLQGTNPAGAKAPQGDPEAL